MWQTEHLEFYLEADVLQILRHRPIYRHLSNSGPTLIRIRMTNIADLPDLIAALS